MMPLTLSNVGETATIKAIGGKPEIKRHLENLGLVAGGSVSVVSILGKNLIVNVKETRIAISHDLAQKIMI